MNTSLVSTSKNVEKAKALTRTLLGQVQESTDKEIDLKNRLKEEEVLTFDWTNAIDAK